jgi:hypothetical protein
MSESESFQQVSVAVPTSRLPEFYEMFGRWLGGEPEPGGGVGDLPGANLVPFAEGSVESIAEWWKMLTKPAKRVFVLLADEPGTQHSGSEIAEACEIEKGANGVAGTLSWPGKHAYNRFGLSFPLNWDRETQKYSMDPDVAALIQQARTMLGEA